MGAVKQKMLEEWDEEAKQEQEEEEAIERRR